jgi:lysine 2,3-aminomutase
MDANKNDDPPGRYRCTERQWNDWNWQLKNRIRTIEQFKEIFGIDPSSVQLEEVIKRYPFAITPYYASLIKKFDYSDPIFAQSVPNVHELEDSKYLSDDPLHESEEMAVPFLVHRYNDRALLLSTTTCGMFCRFCTRKRMVGKKECHISSKRLVKIKSYLLKHNEIKDVIVSGGDPFTQENSFIEEILETLRAIPHIEIIRFGTRTPVVMPQRITPKLVALLKKYKPLWINTHFNHPSEITSESSAACRRIVDGGIPMGNQTVLLKGVNDSSEIIKELCRKLITISVKPYYLYQCDLVKGVEHFRTPVEKGMEIMADLRGRLSGIAIPTFVVDAPGGKGKIPVLPNYYLGKKGNLHKLVNYEGEEVIYPD